ncbi:MAG TPA: hypothetical protein VIM90_04025 [Arenimonas sp.]
MRNMDRNPLPVLLLVFVFAISGCGSKNVPPYWSMTLMGCTEAENARLVRRVLTLARDAGLKPGGEQGSYLANGAPEYVFLPVYAEGQGAEPGSSSPMLVVIQSPGRLRLETLVVDGYSSEKVAEFSLALAELMEETYPRCDGGRVHSGKKPSSGT